MLTDAEAALAQAEYDALPGTPPSGYSAESLMGLNRLEWVRDRAAFWAKQGMEHLRVTIDGGFIWMELWPKRPRKETPFKPWLTEGKTGATK